MFYSMKRTVNYSDLAPDGLLAFDRAVDFLQDCSMFQLETDPMVHEYFKKENIIMYLVSRQIDFIRRAEWGEEVLIDTSPYELKNMYGFRNTNIYDKEGKPCVISYATGCFINADTRRPVKVSADFLEKFSLRPKYEIEYTSIKIHIP